MIKFCVKPSPFSESSCCGPTDGHSSERRWSQSWPGAQVASGHAAVGATAPAGHSAAIARRALAAPAAAA